MTPPTSAETGFKLGPAELEAANLHPLWDRFRTLTESLPVGVYQADAEGSVSYVNPQMAQVVGIEDRPATYEDAMAPVHPEDARRVAKGLASMLFEARSFHDQYRIIGDDGTVRWVSHRATATVDEEGRTTGIIGSIEDVTALLAAPNVRIERIVSRGHASPPNFWYDQPQAEWVIVLAGSAAIAFEGEASPMRGNRSGLMPAKFSSVFPFAAAP